MPDRPVKLRGRRLSPWRLVNYGLAAAALAFVVWQLHLPTLRRDLAGLRWGLVAAAVGLDVLSISLQAFRWRYLLRPAALPFITVVQATYVGTLFNEVLPLRTGEVVRGLIVARRTGRGLATVLSTEVVERVSDGLALVVLVWFAVRHLDLPVALRIAQTALEIAVAVLLVVLFLLALRGESLRDRLGGWRPAGKTGGLIRQIGVDLAAGLRVLRDVRAVVLAAVVALAMNALQVLILWIMLRAYNIDLTVLHAAAVLAVISVGIFLPNAPGNVGPWQFFCVLGLSLFGVDSATAAGFSLVAFVLLTVPLVVGGGLALATSPFTWAELRRFPSSGEPLGGALDLVARTEGELLPATALEPAAQASVLRLFRAYGYNCTAYLTTEAGLRRWVAPDEQGMVAFTRIGDVAVALGEPLAPPDFLGRAAHGFEAAVATEGVDQICFYAVSARAAVHLRAAGYQLMPLGPEAVFYLDDFTLAGGRMKSVRYQVNRLMKTGAVTVVEVAPRENGPPRVVVPGGGSPPLAPEEIHRQMIETAAAWEEARAVSGLGFTISRPQLHRPTLRRYFTLLLDEQVLGFFTYGPIPARNGWYLDNERRRPEAPQGVTETLVAETHRILAEEGASLVSWGTTALARPAEDRHLEEHRLLAQAFSLAFKTLDFLYPYQGLFRNKAKYHPSWEETYLAYRPRFGPRMAYAIVKAHHPSGVSDLLLSRLRAGRQASEKDGAREE